MSKIIDLLKQTVQEQEQKQMRRELYHKQITENVPIDFSLEAINLLDESTGIYSIINTKSKKKYIGKSRNMKKRLISHLSMLERNQHHSKRLQDDFNISGSSVFKITILERIDVKKYNSEILDKILTEKENKWLKTIDFNHDYNILEFGTNNTKREEIYLILEKKIVHIEEQNQLKDKQIKSLAKMISILINVFVKSEANLNANLQKSFKNLSENENFNKLENFIEKIATDSN